MGYDLIKAFSENRFPVNPPLPVDFDDTPNDDRPRWQIQYLWGRPYIQVEDFAGLPEYKADWPEGRRYDVRCLDGGARDRSTTWGMFGTLQEAIECCKTGPEWRQTK